MHKERPPAREDWWYVRAASILRKLYKQGPIGVAKLRKYYGGRKNRGHKPDKSFIGSGNIIRKILQQLEILELAAKVDVKGHKGRIITPKGKSFLDKLAIQIQKANKKPVKKQEIEEETAEDFENMTETNNKESTDTPETTENNE